MATGYAFRRADNIGVYFANGSLCPTSTLGPPIFPDRRKRALGYDGERQPSVWEGSRPRRRNASHGLNNERRPVPNAPPSGDCVRDARVSGLSRRFGRQTGLIGVRVDSRELCDRDVLQNIDRTQVLRDMIKHIGKSGLIRGVPGRRKGHVDEVSLALMMRKNKVELLGTLVLGRRLVDPTRRVPPCEDTEFDRQTMRAHELDPAVKL